MPVQTTTSGAGGQDPLSKLEAKYNIPPTKTPAINYGPLDALEKQYEANASPSAGDSSQPKPINYGPLDALEKQYGVKTVPANMPMEASHAVAQPAVQEGPLRDMMLQWGQRTTPSPQDTTAINPTITPQTTQAQLTGTGIKLPQGGQPSQEFMGLPEQPNEDAGVLRRYGSAIASAIPEEINATVGGIQGAGAAMLAKTPFSDAALAAKQASSANLGATEQEGLTGGASAANFIAKMPLVMARIGAETALGGPGMAVAGESMLGAGSKFIQAKNSGATDNEALASAGIAGTGTAILLSVPGSDKVMSVPKAIATRIFRAAGLATLGHLIDSGATATYSTEEAKKQLTDWHSLARSGVQMGAWEGIGLAHDLGRIAKPTTEVMPAPARTFADARTDFESALKSGDLEGAKKFKAEADSMRPKPVVHEGEIVQPATPIGPDGTVFKGTSPYGVATRAPEGAPFIEGELVRPAIGMKQIPELNMGERIPDRPGQASGEGFSDRINQIQMGIDSDNKQLADLRIQLEAEQDNAKKTGSKKAKANVNKISGMISNIESSVSDREKALSVFKAHAPIPLGGTDTPTDTGAVTDTGAGTGTEMPTDSTRAIPQAMGGGDTVPDNPKSISPDSEDQSLLPAVETTYGADNVPVNKDGLASANAGLNIPQALRDAAEATKERMGLPEGASDTDLAYAVAEKLGNLGRNVKETAVKILNNVKGIGKDLANAIAEHLHKMVSGTREGQLGAIGEDLSPDYIADRKKQMEGFHDSIREMYPGDENKEKRALLHQQVGKMFYGDNASDAAAPPSTLKTLAPIKSDNPLVKSVMTGYRQVRGLLSPDTVSQTAQRFADLSAEHDARRAREIGTANKLIADHLRMLIGQPKSVQENYQDAFENPRAFNIQDPVTKQVFDLMHQSSDALWHKLNDRGMEMGYIEDYLHHEFEGTPEEIDLAIKKATLDGNLGYLKERHGPNTYAIGREIGLTPKDSNVFSGWFSDFVNKQKFVYKNDLLSGAIQEGMISDTPQPGWTKLNGDLFRAFTNNGTSDSKVYYAPREVANLLSNKLSRGMDGIKPYEWARWVNNSMNQVNLGLSYFHGAFIARDMADTMMGSALTDIVRNGPSAENLKNLATGATPVVAQAQMLSRGKELEGMLNGQREPSPGDKSIMDDMMLGGVRAEMDPEYINNSIDDLRLSWSKAKDQELPKDVRVLYGVKTLGEIPFSVLEGAARPVMEKMVPRAKLAAFEMMWNVEKKSFPDDITPQERARRARITWDDVENRMGQLTMDNLGWNKGFKQTLQLVTRALTWKLGSERILYGLGKDMLNASRMGAEDAASGLGLVSQDKRAEQIQNRRVKGVFGTKDYFTQRMGYGVASAMSTAIANGLMTYAGNKIYNKLKDDKTQAADETPHGMDYVFFRIGQTHYALPGYAGEALGNYMMDKKAILHHDLSGFIDFAKNASSPFAQAVYHGATGTDYKGDKQSLKKTLSQAYSPISMKNTDLSGGQTLSEKVGPNPLQTGASLVGINEAKKEYLRSDAENRAVDLLQDSYPARSEVKTDHLRYLKRLTDFHNAGDDTVLASALSRGDISAKEYNTILANKSKGDLLTKMVGSRLMDPEDALDIYKHYATPEEQKKIMNAMKNKRVQAISSAIPNQKQATIQRWSIIK